MVGLEGRRSGDEKTKRVYREEEEEYKSCYAAKNPVSWSHDQFFMSYERKNTDPDRKGKRKNECGKVPAGLLVFVLVLVLWASTTAWKRVLSR